MINLGSIDSEVPLAYQGSYAASKAGVRSLGESLNQELRLAGYDEIKVSHDRTLGSRFTLVGARSQLQRRYAAHGVDGWA
jgi:NADP-dependent 3-hydroxy acid dehydrogenase YdfG